MPDEIKRNIEIYEEVILKLCQLFKKIGISEKPIKVYEVFRYMCLNGYLSSGKFSDSMPESFINLELGGYISMDVTGSVVMANYGVCRHTTDFLSHIYCLQIGKYNMLKLIKTINKKIIFFLFIK